MRIATLRQARSAIGGRYDAFRLGAWLTWLTLSAPAWAQHHHAPDAPGIHGMVIFGKETVYASHLPYFHSPHHYQVLVRLRLSAADSARWRAEQQAQPEVATYTLVPESFVLPDMLARPRPFRALLYRGHFERGGTPVGDSLTVHLDRVLYRQQLPEMGRATFSNELLLIGNAREQFVLHRIRQAPDVDQIIQVTASIAVLPDRTLLLRLPAGQRSARQPAPLGVSGNQLSATLPTGQPITVTLLRQIYLEFADLAR